MNPFRTLAFVGSSALALLLMLPTPAQARKVPIPYHTGQDVFTTGPLPEPFSAEPSLEGFSAGYRCEIWGVVWAYFSIDKCQPVVVKGDMYGDADSVPPELLAAIQATYTQADMQVGFWTKHGRWLLIFGALGAIGAAVFIRDDDEEDGVEQANDSSA